jgi:hypothetical protein
LSNIEFKVEDVVGWQGSGPLSDKGHLVVEYVIKRDILGD